MLYPQILARETLFKAEIRLLTERICPERELEADTTFASTVAIAVFPACIWFEREEDADCVCIERELDAEETAVKIEEVACSRDAFVASEPPLVNVSSVNRRVAELHTSAASVPKVDNVLEVLLHTALAIVLVEVTYVPSTINVLSTLMRSPARDEPQDIVVGHGPSAADPGTE